MKVICILKLFIVYTWLKFHILLSFQIKKKKIIINHGLNLSI